MPFIPDANAAREHHSRDEESLGNPHWHTGSTHSPGRERVPEHLRPRE